VIGIVTETSLAFAQLREKVRQRFVIIVNTGSNQPLQSARHLEVPYRDHVLWSRLQLGLLNLSVHVHSLEEEVFLLPWDLWHVLPLSCFDDVVIQFGLLTTSQT
jgi:hypothetical protein